MTSFNTMYCNNGSYCVPMCRMQGVVKIQSFNPIMGMKVECKAARGSRTQQYTHKNTMSAETGLSAWSLLSLCSGLSLSRRAMTGHQTCEYGLLLYRWKTVGSMVGSEKVTIILSALSHLSTQSAKTQKKILKKAAVIVTKESESNGNLRRILFVCIQSSEIDTSNTSRMTFTKNVLQSIKLRECQSSSQSSLEADAEAERSWSWMWEWSSLKSSSEIGQEGTLFPSKQASVLMDQNTLLHCVDG